MAHIIADRVGEFSTTTGTGVYDLNGGAVFGFRVFDDVMASADTCYAVVVMGNEWEVGLYIFSPGTPDQLTRSVILASTNGDAAVNWGAGTKEIYLGHPAAALRGRQGTDIAAAATLVLDNVAGDVVDVTGNTGITAITLAAGREVTCRFTGTPTITHGVNLVLPGATPIDVMAGGGMADYAVFRGYAGGVVRCTDYIRGNPTDFIAFNSATDSDVTGDGTAYTIICNTEVYDKASDYDLTTGIHTASARGTHLYTASCTLTGLTAGTHVMVFNLETSNRTYQLGSLTSPATTWSFNGVMLADMDKGDTAKITITVSGGAKTVDVLGHASIVAAGFCGRLLR